MAGWGGRERAGSLELLGRLPVHLYWLPLHTLTLWGGWTGRGRVRGQLGRYCHMEPVDLRSPSPAREISGSQSVCKDPAY